MTTTLGDALPAAISKVGELIGAQEAMADQLDEVMPGSASGTRGVIAMLRSLLARAVLAQASGDVVEMLRAYQALQPALALAGAGDDPPKGGEDV
jgi:hypothetical protein